MKNELKQKVDLMVSNYNDLKPAFKWDNNLLKHFGALVHATRGKRVDIERLKEIREYLKDQTSWMSYFRGTNEFLLTNLLCLEEDYRVTFNNMTDVYGKMTQEGLKKSTHLPLAAYTIVKESPRDEWIYKVKRTKAFYDRMKDNHRFLTSTDDYVFAAVLSTTDLEVEATTIRIEECYNYLSDKGLHKGNDLQSLSHILAMGEESVADKCDKAISLYNKLKDSKMKLYYNGLSTLGLLALATDNVDEVISQISEVFDYISNSEGFGFWSIDKNTKIILSSNLVSDFYVEEIKKGVLQITLGNSINAIIIAQQQAMIATMVATSAAATSSSNQ